MLPEVGKAAEWSDVSVCWLSFIESGDSLHHRSGLVIIALRLYCGIYETHTVLQLQYA